MRTPLAVTAAALLIAGAGLGAPAFAQNPSAESIIQSLKPSGGATTRGIHPVGPEAGAPAPGPMTGGTATVHPIAPRGHAAARMTAPPPAAAEGSPSVNLTVQFRTGSADLTSAAEHTLDELGHALSSPSLASFRFRIEGHTDTVGSADKNKALSQERAEKVVDYLASKFGVDKSRLEAVGMGEEGLLVQTPPQTPEPRNRRVTVVNVGA
ncbi:MAG: OmpA family protein [Alphaproteobacteria bacterium]|nr:OmpA family protein [Alphaproteobacteria bacterium]